MFGHHTIAPVFLLGGCLFRKLRLPKQNERRRLQGTLRGIHQMLVLLPELSSVLFPSFAFAIPRACKPHLLLDCFRLILTPFIACIASIFACIFLWSILMPSMELLRSQPSCHKRRMCSCSSRRMCFCSSVRFFNIAAKCQALESAWQCRLVQAFVELESKCLHSAQHNNKPIRQLNGVASNGCDLFCFFDLVYCSYNALAN